MSTEPVKVLCFDTLLQVLILKVVRGVSFCPPPWTAKTAAAPAKMTEFLGKVEIKKAADKPPHRRCSALLPGKYSSKRTMGSQEILARVVFTLSCAGPALRIRFTNQH